MSISSYHGRSDFQIQQQKCLFDVNMKIRDLRKIRVKRIFGTDKKPTEFQGSLERKQKMQQLDQITSEFAENVFPIRQAKDNDQLLQKIGSEPILMNAKPTTSRRKIALFPFATPQASMSPARRISTAVELPHLS